ncbi:hypothetical protein HWV62_22098 [Athelia sp. TMB]|nr:hypothetical protein HWV62_22098 [Athelia sp. TMB]
MSLVLDMQALSLDLPTAGNGTLQLEPAFAIQSERVARLLTVIDITDGILRSTQSILDIFAFGLTCHLAHRAAKLYTARAYDIHRELSRFFSDPMEFRRMQAETGTLISGSFAVQFFERTVYPGSDMDIYAHPGFSKSVGEWLYEEGYRLSSTNRHKDMAGKNWEQVIDDNWVGLGGTSVDENHEQWANHLYVNGRVSDVCTWHKATDGLPLVVQVMSCNTSPLHAIMSFHSTVVQNAISHRGAYAFYPLATFGHHHGLKIASTTRPADAAYQKYRDRGWTIDCTRVDAWYCPFTARFPTDAHAWVIAFPTLPPSATITHTTVTTTTTVTSAFATTVETLTTTASSSTTAGLSRNLPPPHPATEADAPDPMCANSFVLRGQNNFTHSMRHGELSHPMLRLRYLVADPLVLRNLERTLETHWKVNRRRLEALELEERYKHWIWWVTPSKFKD